MEPETLFIIGAVVVVVLAIVSRLFKLGVHRRYIPGAREGGDPSSQGGLFDGSGAPGESHHHHHGGGHVHDGGGFSGGGDLGGGHGGGGHHG